MIIVNKGADYSALGLGRAFIPEDQISNEVKAIMAHYSNNDIVKTSALQEFFNSIGSTLKAKLRNMICPLFASTTEEALYDIIADSSYNSVGGSNPNSLNTDNNRLRVTASVDPWPYLTYQLKGTPSDYSGGLTIAISNIPDGTMYGADISLNDSPVHELKPTISGNTKIIGAGIVNSDSQLAIIRLGDKDAADKVTVQTTKPAWYEGYGRIFGSGVISDVTQGVRVLLVVDQLLTVAEAKILRDAVKALDDKFYE